MRLFFIAHFFLLPASLGLAQINAPYGRIPLPNGANVSHTIIMKNAVKEIPILFPEDKERFWSRVKITEADACWEWQGAKCNRGYGTMVVEGVQYKTHRIAYSVANGDVPVSLFVCHRCDNPSCCNPAHLFLGTHTDNMRDMFAKGRRNHARGDRQGFRVHPESAPMGERNAQAKLTEATVREILRVREETGIGKWKIARMFNISRTQAQRIISKKSWKHIHKTGPLTDALNIKPS